jgi:hypothetical protein
MKSRSALAVGLKIEVSNLQAIEASIARFPFSLGITKDLS